MSDNKECFFIAPIGDKESKVRERSNKVMEYIVEETVSDYGYSVTRADQMDQPGSITNQVIEKTVNSELVIADLTGHNPNVFYELAVRHATGEPYIQLIKINESIPFDISDFRTIKYGLEVDEAEQAKEKIRGLLESLLDGEPEFDNPISESAEMQSLRESADPTDQNLAEVLETMYKLDKKVNQLETTIRNSNLESNSQSLLGEFQPNDDRQSRKVKFSSDNKRDLYKIIRQSELAHEKGASKEDLLSTGMSEDEIDATIEELMMDGHIYEVDENIYKTI
ncbi:hypothetical protein ACFQMA_05330 [Halosimplex aquaticum]|uniref:Replication protein A C-terminal domain-containing protein n=1 Tax=Halosimplex aquaticum TaxID=3026162 RepID=A0ABD5XVT2_9EURY|nr:hypothetical protein [Halosimplex aquaticum]